jgi:hypothetical protein
MYDSDSMKWLSVEAVATEGNVYGIGLLFRWRRSAVQCAMLSRKKFYDMTHTFVTTQPILLVILSAGLVADRLPSVSSPQTKFGGHKFKRDCDMKTAVTRCLIREGMD